MLTPKRCLRAWLDGSGRRDAARAVAEQIGCALDQREARAEQNASLFDIAVQVGDVVSSEPTIISESDPLMSAGSMRGHTCSSLRTFQRRLHVRKLCNTLVTGLIVATAGLGQVRDRVGVFG